MFARVREASGNEGSDAVGRSSFQTPITSFQTPITSFNFGFSEWWNKISGGGVGEERYLAVPIFVKRMGKNFLRREEMWRCQFHSQCMSWMRLQEKEGPCSISFFPGEGYPPPPN